MNVMTDMPNKAVIDLSEDPLPGPFREAVDDEHKIRPVVESLANGQVSALLEASPAFHQISEREREEMRTNLTKIAAYTASLIDEDWNISADLGQTPVVKTQKVVEGTRTPEEKTDQTPLARAQADGFRRDEDGNFVPVAASNVARITEDTLNAIAFPVFVADLLKGTFQAIVDATIQQMEAYGELLANVAKTVDQFMTDNITSNNARDWLADSYPELVRIDSSGERPRAVAATGAADASADTAIASLNLPPETMIDDESVENTFVPAARRRLAQSRQQTLATMVLMGIQRIVVTRGRVKATMGFRIDTTDSARTDTASDLETQTKYKQSYGWFLSPYKASIKTNVAYVSSSKKASESEIDVAADLTGEVDLQFKSDVFPLERFADAGVLTNIQNNTANPGANKPITGAGPNQ